MFSLLPPKEEVIVIAGRRMWPASHEVGMMCLRVLSILCSGHTKLRKWCTPHVIGTLRVWLCYGESVCVLVWYACGRRGAVLYLRACCEVPFTKTISVINTLKNTSFTLSQPNITAPLLGVLQTEYAVRCIY